MGGHDAAFLARASAYLLSVPESELRFRDPPDDAATHRGLVRAVGVETGAGHLVRLVVKHCSLRERVGLALVDGLDAVPRAFVDDTSTDQPMDVVMIDAGNTLVDSDARGRALAAAALSEVHAHLLGHDGQLSDLPPLTQEFFNDQILSPSWRAGWVTSSRSERFQADFGSWQRPVEESAASLANDFTGFADRLQLNTLVHTNISPGQLLEHQGRALIINWGHARRACLFVDLGSTFDTLEAGWVYRDALAHRGVFIDDDVFRRGHRLARRLAGINNLPLRLNAWLTHPEETNHAALQHTLTMAAGHD